MTGKYKILLEVGRKQHLSTRRVTVAQFRAMEAASSQGPVRYMTVGERTFWRYADRWHTDNEGLTQEAVHALLITRAIASSDVAGLLLALRAPATSLPSVALRGAPHLPIRGWGAPSAPPPRLLRARHAAMLHPYRLRPGGRCPGAGAVTLDGTGRQSMIVTAGGGCACRPAATLRCSTAARPAAA